MSRNLTALIVGVVASLALVAGTMQGCSSSGNNYQDLCNQACDKALACTPDAGSLGEQTNQACKSQCASQQCANASAIASKVQECLNMQDCTAAGVCAATIPACQSAAGTGGTTGMGGTGGAGGAGGAPAGDCSICTKADGCCAALDPTANCVLSATCLESAPAQQTQVISACQGLLNVAAGQPTAPAACK